VCVCVCVRVCTCVSVCIYAYVLLHVSFIFPSSQYRSNSTLQMVLALPPSQTARSLLHTEGLAHPHPLLIAPHAPAWCTAAPAQLPPCPAQVMEADSETLRANMHSAKNFQRADHWPKPLLVRYVFHTRNDVDLERGLWVLLSAGEGAGARACLGGGATRRVRKGVGTGREMLAQHTRPRPCGLAACARAAA